MSDRGGGRRTSVHRYVRSITRRWIGLFAGEPDAESPSAGDEEDASAPDRDAERVGWLDDVAPGDLNALSDVIEELGLTPEAFVLRLVEEEDGLLRQQAISDYTNWSESTITRLLQNMERGGLIERMQVGREKLVYLPGDSPADDLSSTRESEDPRTA